MDKEPSYKHIFNKSRSRDIEDVASFYEYSVIISSLEAHAKKNKKVDRIIMTAPEIGINKNVAIIRHPCFFIDLVNPRIASYNGQYIRFGDYCKKTHKFYNTMRYDHILLENMISREIKKYTGYYAFFVQKGIDLIHGIHPEKRKIKLAKVRPNGVLYNMDFCPCGSTERFYKCCKKNH